MSTKTITLGSSQTIRVSIKNGNIKKFTPLLVFNGIGADLSLLSPFVDAMHEMNPKLEVITFDCPERVGKLILAATATGITSIPPSLKVLSLMASPRRYTDPEYMASIAPDLYGGKFRTDPALAAEYAAKMSKNKDGGKKGGLGYKYQQLAICWWSSVWMLPSIKQKTLLLCGDDDPLINPLNMVLMKKLIPDSELCVIEQGGHLFLLTHLDEVVPIIEKFLEGE